MTKLLKIFVGTQLLKTVLFLGTQRWESIPYYTVISGKQNSHYHLYMHWVFWSGETMPFVGKTLVKTIPFVGQYVLKLPSPFQTFFSKCTQMYTLYTNALKCIPCIPMCCSTSLLLCFVILDKDHFVKVSSLETGGVFSQKNTPKGCSKVHFLLINK